MGAVNTRPSRYWQPPVGHDAIQRPASKSGTLSQDPCTTGTRSTSLRAGARFGIELGCDVVDLLLKPARALALGVTAGDRGKVGSRLREGNLQPVVCKLVRDGGDEFVVAGIPSDERHVSDSVRLVEVCAAALLGCGLVTTALLSDVHLKRNEDGAGDAAGSALDPVLATLGI
jgi:hypothetical protein